MSKGSRPIWRSRKNQLMKSNRCRSSSLLRATSERASSRERDRDLQEEEESQTQSPSGLRLGSATAIGSVRPAPVRRTTNFAERVMRLPSSESAHSISSAANTRSPHSKHDAVRRPFGGMKPKAERTGLPSAGSCCGAWLRREPKRELDSGLRGEARALPVSLTQPARVRSRPIPGTRSVSQALPNAIHAHTCMLDASP